jgi:hypothetical protein
MMLRRLGLVVVAAALITAILVVVKLRAERRLAAELTAIETAVEDDGIELDLPTLEPEAWVRQYRPDASAGGYTLVLYRRRLPMIIDMNGRIVHAWPKVRAVGRARLRRDGRLAVIGTDNLIKEYDWDGHLTWYFRLATEGDFPHHDLAILGNGNYLVLARDKERHTCYLEEVDRRRRVVWSWRSIDHMADFPTWDVERKDPTHFNSIFELGPNRWFDGGDERFRPGNILVSARHLNTVFIIDKRSGEVVWQYSKGLDYQHEATMIEKGRLGEGLILVFNNGTNGRNGYRRTLAQAIDPQAGEVAWQYGSEYFFSSVAGTVQALPGDNLAIASSHGGRIFEITPAGEIVWEWVPPYLPMRPERVPSDYCPQLAALPPQKAVEVRLNTDVGPYIDIDLYRFALSEEDVTRVIEGIPRQVLRDDADCRRVLVPPGAEMWVEFGIDQARVRGKRLEARFVMTIQDEGREPETLLDRRLNLESESPWRGRMIPLGRYAYRTVELCVATEAEGDVGDPLAAVTWGNPLIQSSIQHPVAEVTEEVVTEQERNLREQQLKALGYVN